MTVDKLESFLSTCQDVELTIQKYSEYICSSHSMTSTSGVTDLSPDSPATSPIANNSWKKNQLSSGAQTETAILLSSESEFDYGDHHFKRKKKIKGRQEDLDITEEEKRTLENFHSVIQSLDGETQSRGTWPRNLGEQRMRPSLKNFNYQNGQHVRRKDSFKRVSKIAGAFSSNQQLEPTTTQNPEGKEFYQRNRLYNNLATSLSSPVPCSVLNSDQGITNIAVVSPQKKPTDTKFLENSCQLKSSSLNFDKIHRSKLKSQSNKLRIPSKVSISSASGNCTEKGL